MLEHYSLLPCAEDTPCEVTITYGSTDLFSLQGNDQQAFSGASKHFTGHRFGKSPRVLPGRPLIS